jgi:hypothetical protein
MFASVYRAMRGAGLPDPRRVDALYLWEIAVLIGADGYDRDPETGTPRARNDEHSHLRADLEYRRQMAAFAAGMGPEPDRATHYTWDDDEPDDGAYLASVLADGSSL